jgi:indolepyruvate ferredoxin oxidoreductase, alpha subunit
MNEQLLLSGNEAIARGAWQAGVRFASGYPGTPSTEILESLVAFKDDLYLEWSPNEKVAFEAAAGAAMTGARSLVTMKHVGLNVAADPLMTLSYMGVEGGMVICVADDPGQHSSQNEQDTRHYARFAKVPVLEPSDSQEALDFTLLAFEISEAFKVPVILRTTTRVSHSRSVVVPGGRKSTREPAFVKNPERWVPIPLWSRPMRRKLEARYAALSQASAASPANRMEFPDSFSEGNPGLGVIAEGIAYQYVKDAFPEAAVLKLGWAWPYPDSLIRDFAAKVGPLLIVEENEEILEEHVRALGIDCLGRDLIDGVGEISCDKLIPLRETLVERGILDREDSLETAEAKPAPAAALPARPPVLCPGCPHRGVFHALGKHDVIVTGDIGCYSLGVFPPLSRTDAILCMGGGFSMAQGISKSGEKRRVVGIVGDSTFFHSGITGLLDVTYNGGTPVLIVVDNRTTAMTGHQDHAGTGRTLMGTQTEPVSIEAVARACGMKNVKTIDPYNAKETQDCLAEALSRPEASLIVARAPCPLRERKTVGALRSIQAAACKDCGACLKLGCPAIEHEKGAKPRINASLCAGCGLCQQACAFKAIIAADAAEGK